MFARVHFSHRRIIKIPANDRMLANNDKRSAPPSSIRQTSEKQLFDSEARETHRAFRSAFPTYLLHPARDSDPACGPAYQPLARGVVVADRSRFDSNSIRTSRRKARRALVSVIGNKFRVKLPVTPGLDPASRTLRGDEERRSAARVGEGARLGRAKANNNNNYFDRRRGLVISVMGCSTRVTCQPALN